MSAKKKPAIPPAPKAARAAVAKHVANIFTKMGLGPDEDNRRVRAVLAYLNR